MPDGLYETDALAWAEQQSDLLSRFAAGERLNAAIDWEHVVEEIRDVGLSQLHRCEGLLMQAMLHLLKLHVWPESRTAGHWRRETVVFLAGARRNFAPSMRQRIDPADLYRSALRAMIAGRDAPFADLPEVCPFELADLLADPSDVARLLRAI